MKNERNEITRNVRVRSKVIKLRNFNPLIRLQRDRGNISPKISTVVTRYSER